MEKLINFIKSHPALTAVVAVGVLVIIFWPRGGQVSSGSNDAVAAAAAIASSQQSVTQQQLSSDQVRALGLQAAAAEAMNASDNAAAVAVATLKNQTDQKAIDAELAAAQGASTASLAAAKIGATATLAGKLADTITQTQATSLAAGKNVDSAGFSLLEMFKNILNADKGIAATQTLINENAYGVATQTWVGGNATASGSSYTTQDEGGYMISTGNNGKHSTFNSAARFPGDRTQLLTDG